MDNTIKFLKTNIRYYRTKMDITQESLADKCEVSRYYISEIERGGKYPSLKTLIKIANVFNIPVYLLLVDSDNHNNDLIELFSKDLQSEISNVINNLKKRY